MTIISLYTHATGKYSPIANNNKTKSNYFSGDNYSDSFTPSQDLLKLRIARKLIEKADGHLSHDQYNEAKDLYLEAIKENESLPASYYGLAKIYKKQNDLPMAIETYNKLLNLHPDEIEARTLKGNCHKELGQYEEARECFRVVNEKNPKYDFATRSLKEVDNIILAKTNPALARQLREQQGNKNLREALRLAVNYLPKQATERLQDVTYAFDKTDSLSGHQNIAQYEHSKRKITVKEDYRWAAPEIVAAYLVHENIHASDKDAYTSIYEEQDAYERSIMFWVEKNNGIKDPELDYAAELYKQSPQALRNKVGDVYRTRDKSISEYSPYHTPPNASTGLNLFDSIFTTVSSVFGLN